MASASPKIDFEIVCPNNHNQTVSFSGKSFEAALKSGEPLFHCNTCDTNWNPSTEQITDMRKRLSPATPDAVEA